MRSASKGGQYKEHIKRVAFEGHARRISLYIPTANARIQERVPGELTQKSRGQQMQWQNT